MEWSTDVNLQAKMAITLILLIVTGLAAAVATGIAVVLAGSVLLIFVDQPSQLLSVPVILVCVVIAAGGILTLILWGEREAPEHAIATIDAHPINTDEYPHVRPLVRSLAQQIDVPPPSLYVARREIPLSMTTGFQPNNARLIVSEGLLELLSEEELTAVLAHELAHIKNRDAAVMTAAAFPFGAATRVIDLLTGPTAGVEHGQPSRADYADGLMVVGLSLVIPVWVSAQLLTASLSRTREFAADRGAVAITGDPAALAAALERIDTTLADRPVSDLRNTEIAAFAIIEPPVSTPHGLLASARSRLRHAFATHPPMTERLTRLQEMYNFE